MPQPKAHTKAPKSGSVGRTIRTVIYVVIAVITTIFLVSNSQTVEVNYIFGTAQTPLFLALGIALILGVLLTLGAFGIWKVRHRDRSA